MGIDALEDPDTEQLPGGEYPHATDVVDDSNHEANKDRKSVV